MREAERRAALVTGASSGIGLELALRIAAGGRSVILHGRSAERLAALARRVEREHGVRAIPVARDLAETGAAAELREEVRRTGLEVDVLVNNAGLGAHGAFAEGDLETQLEMIRVNVLALTELAGLFLPAMMERGEGRVLNVASTAAFQPGPLMAVYYATKAYVLSFSEALAEEVRGTGVTVTTLCPGPTRTRFQARAGAEGTRLLSGALVPVLDAAGVAEAGYRGLMRGDRLVVPGLRNRLLVQSLRVSPRALVLRLVRRLNERRAGR